MIYSQEEIYKFTGQFDKVVSVSFRFGSEAAKKYGSYITGTFYYTPDEREKLEEAVAVDDFEKTDGLIKFKAGKGINQLSEEQIGDLRFEGILASDIIEILSFAKPVENEFSKSDIRNLPDPIVIKSNFSDVDEEELTLWTNNQRLKSGFKLIPEEINRHNGIILRKYEDKMPEEHLKNFKDPETGEIKKGIKYHYLNSKYYKDLLSNEEKAEFEKVINEDVDEKIKILGKELQKSQDKWKEVGINYKDALAWLIHFSSSFRPERLTHGKIPVWWDYESLLHIYMRHVSETQIGERFESKTVFQYKFKDIKRVIEMVLRRAEDEIIQHFTEHPDRDFRRVGAQSVYFNGDYYTFHISPGGRLRTFYKNN
ncbi:hypothetical protein [Flagellimonas nanhaiensis]|uniref:Uncharacterized protein n=1 Tax=Flagellimonas nanhaiensis TaxID=2292706 RepID=A0A371JML5_9FLAO|nr:hypothetical protein [Allomuricauda nanhaiensis]RDY58380.1 hypothetical protein DX873_15360 [Allomuricauda nanhaiensis]